MFPSLTMPCVHLESAMLISTQYFWELGWVDDVFVG